MPTRDVHKRYLFDGLTEPGDAPEAFYDHVGYEPDQSFKTVLNTIDDEYGIGSTELYYKDPKTGELERLPHWQATVNPHWCGEDGEGRRPAGRDARRAVWDTPTSGYTPVTPAEWWEPLIGALKERDIGVFGALRLSRDGGVQVWDIFFQGVEVPFDGEADKIMGVTTGQDYMGGRTLFANSIAFDPMPESEHATVLRDITDARKRKHTGEADDEVVEWWGEIIDASEEVAETLYGVVTDAMAYEIDIGDMPCSLPEFYEHLGLPMRTVAEAAGKRAVATCRGEWTAYHLHRAGMWVMEHEYGGKDSSTFAEHVATLNTLLYNPARAERQVLESIREDLDEEQTELDDAGDYTEWKSKAEKVDDHIDSIPEGVDAFTSARERLRTMLTDLEDDDQDGEDDASSDADEPGADTEEATGEDLEVAHGD